ATATSVGANQADRIEILGGAYTLDGGVAAFRSWHPPDPRDRFSLMHEGAKGNVALVDDEDNIRETVGFALRR
ncbi:MAG: hypothetical protein GWM93_07430, partial [Gemmatimonadetes bacterium]|nr:hypothetical protein [Gemmatimonadota bacterium]NIT66507.1 hypothetical protein [Gemmatimonadota bacterium]NIY35084.1 hypothetical protein [Gemmatimonadota bacterium]